MTAALWKILGGNVETTDVCVSVAVLGLNHDSRPTLNGRTCPSTLNSTCFLVVGKTLVTLWLPPFDPELSLTRAETQTEFTDISNN